MIFFGQMNIYFLLLIIHCFLTMTYFKLLALLQFEL